MALTRPQYVRRPEHSAFDIVVPDPGEFCHVAIHRVLEGFIVRGSPPGYTPQVLTPTDLISSIPISLLLCDN
jgi:hypothetical protein